VHDVAIAGTLGLVTVAAFTGGYLALDQAKYAEVLAVSRHDGQEHQGYRVTYLLDGQERMISLDYDPGERIVIEDGSLMLRRLRTLQR
jgi:hypothetical protein